MSFLDNHQESPTDPPRTWPSRYNAMLEALDNATDHVGTRAFLSSAQSVAHSTHVAVELDGETFDYGGWHDTATNPSQVEVAEAGRYRVYGQVGYAANTTGDRMAQIRVNGSQATVTLFPPASLATRMSVSDLLDLAAGDVVELYAWQNSGSTLDLNNTTEVTVLVVEKA